METHFCKIRLGVGYFSLRIGIEHLFEGQGLVLRLGDQK